MGTFRQVCFLLLLAAACFPLVFAEINLYIDYINNGRKVSQGTTAQFECYSTSITQNVFFTGGRIEWRRITQYPSTEEIIARWSRDVGGEIILSDPDNRYTIEDRSGSGGMFAQYLIIRHVEKYDEADVGYFCALFNSTGIQIARATPIKLIVRYPPADHYPVCTASPKERGGEVKLMCASEKTTPIVGLQWYKDDARVSDTQETNYKIQSEYCARADEHGSQFECRLVYRDGDDVEVRRSCKFSRPYVAILRMGDDQSSKQSKYYAFAHSSPPFVSDINCSLQTVGSTPLHFEKRFPVFGEVTVGPVAQLDNGTDLVCRAKNVLGWGEARMPMYATSSATSSGSGETTLPSVVTNYMPDEGRRALHISIWPTHPVVASGENVTFVCSYSLVVHAAPRARVEIEWKFNDVLISNSMSHFTTVSNVLHVSYIPFQIGDGDGDTVTCVASVYVDETKIINIPSQEATAVIELGPTGGGQCVVRVGQSSQADRAQSMTPFIIGVCILVVSLILIMFILLAVFLKRNKQNAVSQSGPEIIPKPQATFRSDPNSDLTRSMSSSGQTIVQRALPAQPEPAVMTTLRSVVTTPVSPPATAAAADPLRKLQLDSASSCTTADTTATDLPYQAMVGDTGVVSSRHGSISTHALRTDLHHIHAQLSRTLSSPDNLVPGPNGGFMPSDIAITSTRCPTTNRSMSDGTQSADTDEEPGYEDPDAVRQRRRLRRAMSNDYQSTKGTRTTVPTGWKAVQFCSLYANSTTGDDSVFLPAV